MKEGTRTFLHKNTEINEKREGARDVQTGVRCKDSQFACTSTPFLSLCTIWIGEKSLNPGWLWTTKRSLNYTPNLQLYARTHSHQAHRGCDMRNQILKKGGTGASLPDVYNIHYLPYKGLHRIMMIRVTWLRRLLSLWIWWFLTSRGIMEYCVSTSAYCIPGKYTFTHMTWLWTFGGYLAQFNDVTRLCNSHRVDRKEWQLL